MAPHDAKLERLIAEVARGETLARATGIASALEQIRALTRSPSARAAVQRATIELARLLVPIVRLSALSHGELAPAPKHGKKTPRRRR